MHRTVQIASAWAAPAFALIILPTFLMMDYLPPLGPSADAEAVAAMYEENRTGIRLGATIIMQFAFLILFWVAAISVQLHRIGGVQSRIFTYAQLLFGLAVQIVFLVASLAWTVAAFRPERDAELIMLMNDIGWLCLVMPVLQATFMALMIGLAILSDPRATPLFPRWAAYLNFWVGLVAAPGALATFFKTGPFAWNGLLTFWLPLVALLIWFVAMAWLTSKAAMREDGAEEQGFASHA